MCGCQCIICSILDVYSYSMLYCAQRPHYKLQINFVHILVYAVVLILDVTFQILFFYAIRFREWKNSPALDKLDSLSKIKKPTHCNTCGHPGKFPKVYLLQIMHEVPYKFIITKE